MAGGSRWSHARPRTPRHRTRSSSKSKSRTASRRVKSQQAVGERIMADSPSGVRRVLAIDPGRAKCGLAVMDSDSSIHLRCVVAATELAERVKHIVSQYKPDAILLG